jgi:CRISPR type I-E-associated protein CasB/Cse2
VARLFGDYPTQGTTPFAVGLARVAEARGGAGMEARMTALVSSPFADLAYPLRRAVGLLRAGGVALDWHRFMGDLLRWDADGEPVQRAWARAYWGGGGDPARSHTAPDGPDTAPAADTQARSEDAARED